MPIQVVTPRQVSLQYDGTNGTAVLAMVNDQMGLVDPSNRYSTAVTADGSLLLTSAEPMLSPITAEVGDHVVVDRNGAGTVPDSAFTRLYTALG